jgi:hypothetical protein
VTGTGVDLGAAFTKVTRLDDAGTVVVPTAVDYDPAGQPWPPGPVPGTRAADGTPHAAAPPGPGRLRCTGFVPLLGRGEADVPRPEWGGRTAAVVARDFLAALPYAAGPVVLLAPSAPDGGELARGLLPPGLRRHDAVPHPAAALAGALAHSDPDLTDAAGILVCDLGAERFSFTLCGRNGGRFPVLDQVVVRAVAPRATVPGMLADLLGVPPPELTAAAAAFEREPPADLVLADVLPRAAAEPGLWADTPVGVLHTGPLTAGALLPWVEATAARIRAALAELAARRPGGLLHDAERAVLAGGFAGIPQFRLAVSAAATDDAVRVLTGADRWRLAATGAALTAAGVLDLVPRSPYAVGVEVHRIVAGRLAGDALELLAAGHPWQAGDRPGATAGSPVVTVPEGDTAPLPVWIRSADGGAARAAATVPPGRPPAGIYRVTAHVDEHGRPVLTLREQAAGTSRSYLVTGPHPEVEETPQP